MILYKTVKVKLLLTVEAGFLPDGEAGFTPLRCVQEDNSFFFAILGVNERSPAYIHAVISSN